MFHNLFTLFHIVRAPLGSTNRWDPVSEGLIGKPLKDCVAKLSYRFNTVLHQRILLAHQWRRDASLPTAEISLRLPPDDDVDHNLLLAVKMEVRL